MKCELCFNNIRGKPYTLMTVEGAIELCRRCYSKILKREDYRRILNLPF